MDEINMKITDIRKLKSGRYGLYCDKGFVLSLDEETYIKSGVTIGSDLDGAQLDSLASRSGEHKAKDKALMLLSYRDHSRQELKKKLMRSADEETADAAADKMEELGLINDEEYAKKLAGELLLRRNFGDRRAIYEMIQRGIDRELALVALEDVDDSPEQRAVRYLDKKFPRGLQDEKSRRRAAAALTRDGFGWDEIKKAIALKTMAE